MVDLNKDAIVAMVFFIMAVILVSQSAISVKTYNDTKKAKDANYWWSVFVLVVSIIGLFVAGYMGFKSQGGSAKANAPKMNAAAAAAGSVAPQPAPMMMVPVPTVAAQPVKTN